MSVPLRRPEDLKTCTKCKEVKVLDDFSPNKHLSRGRQSQCKACCAAQRRLTRTKQLNKHNNLRKYGITTAEWQEMFDSQGGKCRLCGREHSENNKTTLLVVDHNHDTGQVRGLLCSWCNRGLGFLQDNPELLKAAATYLEQEGHYGPT